MPKDIRFTIDVLELPSGEIPMEEAFTSFGEVSPDLLAAVEAGLIRLEYQSNHGGVFTEAITKKVWCMRIRRNRNIARVFFTFRKGRKIILLWGFVKKTTKIPPKDRRKVINYERQVPTYA